MRTEPVTVAQRRAERQRQSDLERALVQAVWRAVQDRPIPVMAALEAAARAVGTLYRDTAAAHGSNGSCGWQPNPTTDVIVLEASLAASATEMPSQDLATMAVAGRA